MCIDKLFMFFKKPITIYFEKEQVEGYLLKTYFPTSVNSFSWSM